MFTGSIDGTVKFLTPEGEVMRQFPLKPADSRSVDIGKGICEVGVVNGRSFGVQGTDFVT